ncbi:MAG: hypothetical protein NBKEAIPA_01492 [Nitrospirae bacterium]|nr:MAG: hypothetical protein UZ03_NOB001000746 [Nitrospira sp. OLB3]MBV6469594.1 hypothetical protein [Nitrospirota bacterium]
MLQMSSCRNRLSRLLGLWALVLWVGLVFVGSAGAESGGPHPDSSRLWTTLIAEAKALQLPTKFLEQIPAQFVRFEFEDLHAYAAEYHPAEHRMVLNRSLSLNAAGGTLRPLKRLTHKELETLYHELFHAYMDFLEQTQSANGPGLLAFAREQQRCRYQHVLITPLLQKKDQKEERFLSETESWEVLNETWAIFIGWAVWTQLEVGKPAKGAAQPFSPSGWLARLEKADGEADLKGYYEPEDPSEQAMARKRFLAPEFRLSAQELTTLMKEVLGSPVELIRQAEAVLKRPRLSVSTQGTCQIPPTP